MKDNETFEFENRQYINPDISRDEQTAFIDTLRDIQAQNNAQIKTETHNLGTDVEPIRGGLTGSEEYWNSRYQTPQTNAAVANMKAVAQQTALNDALTNYQNMLQNRYDQAYRDYQNRAYKHSRSLESSGGGGGGTPTTPSKTDGLTINTNPNNKGDDISYIDENPNTGPGNLVPSGEDDRGATTYTYSFPNGETWLLSNPSAGDRLLLDGPAALGLWPDGTTRTLGSSYTDKQGNTFWYMTADNVSSPQLFKRKLVKSAD